ncbi:hypothetical protein BDZ89DRAFT_1254749 [Hymenopellis radicata]|nr:hypothetical protein BDZ89DRAFT_1254749 [Hymenopellis radicata]
MLLIDLTFRYPPTTGNHIIPLLESWEPQTSGLRKLCKLRLVATDYDFHGYNHKPQDIYWDHPDFARALHRFPSLSVLVFVHPAYVVPIQDPIWRTLRSDDDDEETDNEEGMEVDDDEGIERDESDDESNDESGVESDNDNGVERDDEGHMEDGDEEDMNKDVDHPDEDHDNNDYKVQQEADKEADEEQIDRDQDERLYQARRALRLKQEARYGPRRQRFILEDADWQSGEQRLVMEWASQSLSTIFLVYAHDEASQVEGDFSLEQDLINGRFSHWTGDSSGCWTRRENRYYTRRRGSWCLSQNAVDLKLSGMRFTEDCWNFSNRGTDTLSSAEYNDLST